MTRILMLSVTILILTACGGYTGPNHVYPGYGEATATNAAVMIIDPNPPGAQNTDIPYQGERAAVAYDRYRTDKVEEPIVEKTTSVLSGGN